MKEHGNTLEPVEHRPSFVEIDLEALQANFAQVRKLAPSSKVMAVVKANAYGHGLVTVSRCLEASGADFFGVAFVEEGVQLREAGVRTPILVLGGLVGAQLRLFLENDIDIPASSLSKLEQIDAAAKAAGRKVRVHLKIDTGMERIGVHSYNVREFFESAARCRHCEIVGLFSHFAVAESDPVFTRLQIERFLECSAEFERICGYRPLRHLANSAGTVLYPESHLDMVRTGVLLYGISPDSAMRLPVELRPVLSLKSRVVYFKVVRAGSGVSYGHTWRAPQDTRVVTVPIGYGDGFPRALSNRGSILVRGKRCPIVGRVCMDQLMADIGPDGTAYNGDEVVLIGRQGTEEISVNEIADTLQTTPHEIPTVLNFRLPRLVRGANTAE